MRQCKNLYESPNPHSYGRRSRLIPAKVKVISGRSWLFELVLSDQMEESCKLKRHPVILLLQIGVINELQSYVRVHGQFYMNLGG